MLGGRRAAVRWGMALVLLSAGLRPGTVAPRHPPFDERVGEWRMAGIALPAGFAVPPPPGTGSEAAIADATPARVQSSATRQTVLFWDRHPIDAWLDQAFLAVMSSQPKDPPRAGRAYAYLTVGMYDAVVAAWQWKGIYRRPPPATGDPSAASEGAFSYPSAVAAIAGAASKLLGYLFPQYPSGEFDSIAEQAVASRVAAGVSRPSDVQAGLDLGRRIAAALIARAGNDGADAPWHGHAPDGAAFWAPPPGVDEPPVEPLAGTWRTWFLSSGSQFRPGPPPQLGSDQMLREARAVVAATAHLTPLERAQAEFWRGGQGTPQAPGLWDQIALWYAQRHGLGIPAEARMLAVLNMALADVGVAVWDCKYRYWSPRPENVIRDLGIAPGWTPLLPTPLFPSYVSGHSAFSSAAAEVLASFFPADGPELRAEAWSAAMSRLYGGIHFPSDISVGFRMGRSIGRLALERWRTNGATP